MARRSSDTHARFAALVLVAALASSRAGAQTIVVPSSPYAGAGGYGTNPTTTYSPLGAALPQASALGTGYGTGTVPLYPGQLGLGNSALGNTITGQTVLNQPGSSASIGALGGSGTPDGSVPATTGAPQRPQTGAPAAELPPVAGQSDTSSKDKDGKSPSSDAYALPKLETERVVALQIGDRLHGRPRAVTGDTLSFDDHPVRMSGIRAPEADAVCRHGATAWNCGIEARDALQHLAEARPVTCLVTSVEAGPEASCWTGNEDMAALIVAEGAAFPTDMRFDYLMHEASVDGRGVWARSAPRR